MQPNAARAERFEPLATQSPATVAGLQVQSRYSLLRPLTRLRKYTSCATATKVAAM